MQENDLVTIEQQRKITLSNIGSVISLSDRQIILSSSGGKIVIQGENLKINGFSESTGNFCASGIILSLTFKGKTDTLKNKLFK